MKVSGKQIESDRPIPARDLRAALEFFFDKPSLGLLAPVQYQHIIGVNCYQLVKMGRIVARFEFVASFNRPVVEKVIITKSWNPKLPDLE